MSKLFDSVSDRSPKKNSFDLSHERKFSCNMSTLIPIMCQEVVPGDHFRNNTEVMLRLAPLISPMMHRVNVYTHFFFVPNRLVWTEWQDFITGNATPEMPFYQIDSSNLNLFAKGSLADYLGIPDMSQADLSQNFQKVSSLPFRAYATIFNEYYRDQNLVEEILVNPSYSGIEEGTELLIKRNRAWEKDYLTSALPWAQKGEPVKLPLAGNAPIIMNPNSNTFPLLPNAANAQQRPLKTSDIRQLGSEHPDGSVHPTRLDPNNSLLADLTNVTSTTINDLRTAWQLQTWLEKNARAGTRYTESILAHFGVRSSDARLQRPEYLGGGKSPVVISEVLQTSETTETGTPQGTMTGHGISVGNSHSFTKFFEEHGFVIGIMSVMPRTAYQQGLPRMFTKFDKFQYYWPEFAHLGEQEVLNQEVMVTGENDGQTFGYQSRYAEYKYCPTSVHGDFKDSLSYWHMGRIFPTRPTLNWEFITSQQINRPFAVTDDNVDHLYVQIFNNLQAVRPMPYFGTPSTLG